MVFDTQETGKNIPSNGIKLLEMSCQGPDADFLHIWWEYSKIEPYWRYIWNVVKEETGQEIQLHPRVMLLSDFDKNCRYKDLMANILTASLLLLAQRWKTPIVPTLHQRNGC